MHPYISLLRKRDFSLLCLADAVSVLGDQTGWIALLWFVMVTTHRSTDMGLLALCFGLPGVLLGAISGNILDRLPRKWVLVSVNAFLGIIFMAIPFLFQFHMLSFVLLLTMVVAAGCLVPFTTVGTMVLLPSLVSEDELGGANAFSEVLWQFGSLLGPIVGGIFISRFGATWAVFADGITFWCAALCILLIRNSHSEPRQVDERHVPKESRNAPEEGSGGLGFWMDSWTGLKYLYKTKPVWWITISAVFLNMAYGQIEVGLPLFVHHELHASAALLGTLWTVFFAGSILGTFLGGFWIFRFPSRQGMLMCAMIAGWGIFLLPLFWIHAVWAAIALLFVGEFVFAGCPPIARTAVQRLTPREYQGRVFGIRMSLIALGTPVGSYISGLLANWAEPSSVMGIAGLAVVVLGCILASIRSFRTI